MHLQIQKVSMRRLAVLSRAQVDIGTQDNVEIKSRDFLELKQVWPGRSLRSHPVLFDVNKVITLRMLYE